MVRIIRKAIHFVLNLKNKYANRQFRNQFAKIGEHTIVRTNSQLVPRNMYLEDFVLIQDHNNFISHEGKLIVKKYSVISSGCIIIPSSHKLKVGVPFYLSAMKHVGDENLDIVIEEDCWIGAGVILLPGVKIGRGCVIGAGAIVSKNIPPYAIAVGNPARIIATKFSYEDVLKHEALIYNHDDRLPESIIKDVFETHFKNIRHIGDSDLSNSDKKAIKDFFSNQL